MLHRVSGTLLGQPFVGCVEVRDGSNSPIIKFDSGVKVTWIGVISDTTEWDSISEKTEHSVLQCVQLDRRRRVYLGEFCLGFVLERRMDWVAEPLNHGHLNHD